MTEIFNAYWNVILQERFWSWSIIGIIYLVFAFTVRGWFLNPMFRQAKDLRSRYYQELKQDYLKFSFWGWFFFFLPLIFFTFVWNQTAKEPLSLRHQIALVAGLLCFLWSVMVHMRAFSRACMTLMKELVDEKESQAVIKHV